MSDKREPELCEICGKPKINSMRSVQYSMINREWYCACLKPEAAAPAQPVPPKSSEKNSEGGTQGHDGSCVVGPSRTQLPVSLPEPHLAGCTYPENPCTCTSLKAAAPSPVLTPVTSQRLPEGDIASGGTSGVKVDGRLTEAPALTQPSAEPGDYESKYSMLIQRLSRMLECGPTTGNVLVAVRSLTRESERPVLPPKM